MKVDDFARLPVPCPKWMIGTHSDLSAELGPDHHFHVVPSVGKYCLLSLRVVSWRVAGLPSARRSVVVAPASLIAVVIGRLALWPFLWHTASPFRSPVSTDAQFPVLRVVALPFPLLTIFRDYRRTSRCSVLTPCPSPLPYCHFPFSFLTLHPLPHSVSSHPPASLHLYRPLPALLLLVASRLLSTFPRPHASSLASGNTPPLLTSFPFSPPFYFFCFCPPFDPADPPTNVTPLHH